MFLCPLFEGGKEIMTAIHRIPERLLHTDPRSEDATMRESSEGVWLTERVTWLSHGLCVVEEGAIQGG